jgi:hypothetical protein
MGATPSTGAADAARDAAVDIARSTTSAPDREYRQEVAGRLLA